MTTDGAGSWVAVWYSNDSLGSTIGTDYDILVARSTRRGRDLDRSRGPQHQRRDRFGRRLRIPQVTTDGAGSWVAVWHSGDSLGGTIGTDGDILVARSSDAGACPGRAPAALGTNATSDSGGD